jgi:small subunit ribosomal protein S4
MARHIGSICRLCRREKTKLFLKGIRCYTDKCALARRSYAPGEHGSSRLKLSDYGLQLREKQKVKRIYGVLERQFRRYFKLAQKSRGITGSVLLQLLERRLDNCIFRLGFSLSRAQARQFVRHGWVRVNGQKVNIPSFSVNIGDEIQISTKDNIHKIVKDIVEITKERSRPAWLEVNVQDFKGRVLRFPTKEDLQLPIQEQLIVELYSK